MSASTWEVVWPHCDPAQADHEATVFTTSNGYFATRGTHPEHDRGLPSTCVAGIYTDDNLGFRTIVASGQWLGVKLGANGRQFDPAGRDVAGYRRCYELRRGLVQRTCTWRVSAQAALEVETEHFASLANRRCGWQRYRVTARGASVRVTLAAAVSGKTRTRREALMVGQRVSLSGDGGTILARTAGGEYRVAQHARVTVPTGQRCEVVGRGGRITWTVSARLQDCESLEIRKLVAFAADRDAGEAFVDVAREVAESAAQRGYEVERAKHERAWAKLWREMDITIDGDDANTRAIRFTAAQLLSHAPRDDDRVSLAAKPLSGEGYRGHIFWDTDLFMTPAVTAFVPEVGVRLMNYRHEMLPGARQNAAKWDYRGAWYPWESADDGTEVTPLYWLHADGRKMPITCWKYEIHSVCGVAYAAWEYYLASGDRAWLFERGVEILVETARFWASRAMWNEVAQRYEIHDVCGPDECHERTNNCAYINVLAAWNVEKALTALKMMRSERPAEHDALLAKIGVRREELAEIRRVGAQMYIPRDADTGWYRQFDGFEELEFVDPQTGQERFEEAPDAEKTQIVKQADVVMLMYLLRGEVGRGEMLANWDYYVPRTEHNTSLSAGTHAAVAARLGFCRTAKRFFTQAAHMDLVNWRGDSGRGLHGAALGGALCAVVFGFGGVVFREDELVVDPILAEGWRGLKVPFVYQGRRLVLDVRREGFTLKMRGKGRPITVVNGGKRRKLSSGGVLKGALMPPADKRRTVS